MDSYYSSIIEWERRRRGRRADTSEYMVILARRKGYLLLWTAFMVTEDHTKRKLRKEYEAYKIANAAPEGGIVTPSTHGR